MRVVRKVMPKHALVIRYGLWECRRFNGFSDYTFRYQGLIGQRAYSTYHSIGK